MRGLRGPLVAAILAAPVAWASIGGAQVPARPASPTGAPPSAAPAGSSAPVDQGATRDDAAKPAPRKLDRAALEDAKRAYAAGEAAFKAGEYKSAVESFRDAQRSLPTPHAGYWLALSLKGAGQVPEAIAELKTLLASPLADRLGSEKLETARSTLEALGKTPGVISLQTEPAGATISVDGDVRPAVSPLDVDLMPGTHTLTISLPGYESMELQLEVPAGSKGEQKLTLTALPPPPPPIAGVPDVPAAGTHNIVVRPEGATAAKPGHTGEYVVFGLAGAGAIVGTIFAIRALGKNENASADRVERDTTIAEIGLGAAFTLGLAGLVMATATDELPPGREQPPTAGASVHPTIAISPGRSASAGVAWQF